VRREEAVVGLDRRVEQRAILVVLADPLGGLRDVVGRQRARPEQPPQVAAADLDVGAHEAAQQQRRDVALRRREPPGELGVVGGREVDGVRLQLALLLDRVDRVLVGLRRLDPRLRAAIQRQLPAAGLGVELLAPAVRQPAVDQLREPRRHVRHGRPVERGDLEHAEERSVRLVDVVERRAGAHDAPAAAARTEGHVALHAPHGRGEHAGGDARVGEQAGERLALREDVAVRDDDRAGAAARDPLERAQVAGEVAGLVQLDRDRVLLRLRLERRRPFRARDHVRRADAELGELVQQPPEQRRPLPRQRRRGRSVAGRRRGEKHRRAHRLVAGRRAPCPTVARLRGRSRRGLVEC
jgi:hypothetical protein